MVIGRPRPAHPSTASTCINSILFDVALYLPVNS